MNEVCKRRTIVEDDIKGKIDVLGLSETHFLEQGIARGDSGGEYSVCEGLKGGALKLGWMKIIVEDEKKDVQLLCLTEYGNV